MDDVHKEYERLTGLGVTFTQEPVLMGQMTAAVLDDTCGNLIMIASMHGRLSRGAWAASPAARASSACARS